MLKLRTIITSAVIALATSAFAQATETSCDKECPNKFKPYYFVSAQIGGATTFGGGNPMCSAVSPQYGLSAGKMFTKAVGARINVTGVTINNYLESVDEYYKFNYINPNVDVLINLYQLLAKKPNPSFNAFFLAGVGFNYAWNNDDFANLQAKHLDNIKENTGNAWGTSGSNRNSIFTHSVRFGFMLDFKVSRLFNVGLEGTLSNFGDRFNSINSAGTDWMIAGGAYLTYKFNSCKGKKSCDKK